MGRTLAAFFAGVCFGVGLAVSRMTDPTLVLGFLDLFGSFDPTLAWVMAGAVATTFVAYRLILRRDRPLLAEGFQLPRSTSLDRPLLAGAALFGVGWGITGYCPGPVLVAAASGITTAWIFLPAMLAGMLLHRMAARGGAA